MTIRTSSGSGVGLRTKWTLSLLGVALIPMVVLGLVVLQILRLGLSRAEKELEIAVVDEASSEIRRSLDEAADVAARASAIVADGSIDPDARTRLVAELVTRSRAVGGVSFFDAERHFVDAVVGKPAAEASLRAPPETIGFRSLVLESGAPAFRFEAKLGSPDGFVVVALAPDLFGERLRDLSVVRFGAADRLYLLDESRRVLAGGGRTRPDHPILAGAPSFATELGVTAEYDLDGTSWVGTMRTLPSQHWALVVERPTAEAFAALTKARTAFLVSLAAFTAIAALAGLLVVRRVLGPIESLMGLVERYARRDFTARSDVETRDELEALGTSLEHMADDLAASEIEITKRARIEANLRRYLPEEAAAAAVESEGALDLGGARRRVTVVFADVVAFTGFAEGASPERAVAFLNELFTVLSEVVFRHGGMVDKFIGDCVMAVFRPTTEDDDDVRRALDAAEDMHVFVEANRARWHDEFSFTAELGIGVASGDVLLGNLGSTTRMEYTVIGDAVNVASRLEALAQPRQTLTIKTVVDACPDIAFVSLGTHSLRGKATPVEVFEVES